MCDSPAVVAGARRNERASARVVAQDPLDRPRCAEHLERGQPEAVRFILDKDRVEIELVGECVERMDGRRPVGRETAVERKCLAARGRHVLAPHPGVDDGLQRHTNSATLVSACATTAVSLMLTHSSAAWAPSPPGPNITVGTPAAAMKAASAQ